MSSLEIQSRLHEIYRKQAECRLRDDLLEAERIIACIVCQTEKVFRNYFVGVIFPEVCATVTDIQNAQQEISIHLIRD